ncbi:MAG: MerR family transcriptional regulator [Roseiflexaceae bacterium]
MTKDGVTINELSKMAQVTVRTIRFYTDEGVLDEPAGRDRFARYTLRHFLQLSAAKHLKDRYLPLRVIRDQMASLSDQELERLAGPVPVEVANRFAEVDSADVVSTHALAAVEVSDKVQSVNASQFSRSAPMAMMSNALFDTDDVAMAYSTPDSFLRKTDDAVRRPVASVGDVWHRIVISPSMELHVREDAMHEAGEIRRILASLRKSK